jgi:hypothetical protein
MIPLFTVKVLQHLKRDCEMRIELSQMKRSLQNIVCSKSVNPNPACNDVVETYL